MSWFKDQLMEIYTDLAENYKKYKDEGKDHVIDDDMLQAVAEGGYLSNNGDLDNIKQGYKPYYDYLKYANQYQEEVKEKPIMIEDNYNYETPYSFEYEPYMIEFNHEVDTNNSIQMIEEMYNEDNIEEDIDSNEIIDVLSFLSNKISKVKNIIIHYISNYRPIMNQYTHNIDAVLIE